MTSAYPDEPGIDPDKWEESPHPDRDNDEDSRRIGDVEHPSKPDAEQP
jgi:hypothetical protein